MSLGNHDLDIVDYEAHIAQIYGTTKELGSALRDFKRTLREANDGQLVNEQWRQVFDAFAIFEIAMKNQVYN